MRNMVQLTKRSVIVYFCSLSQQFTQLLDDAYRKEKCPSTNVCCSECGIYLSCTWYAVPQQLIVGAAVEQTGDSHTAPEFGKTDGKTPVSRICTASS